MALSPHPREAEAAGSGEAAGPGPHSGDTRKEDTRPRSLVPARATRRDEADRGAGASARATWGCVLKRSVSRYEPWLAGMAARVQGALSRGAPLGSLPAATASTVP